MGGGGIPCPCKLEGSKLRKSHTLNALFKTEFCDSSFIGRFQTFRSQLLQECALRHPQGVLWRQSVNVRNHGRMDVSVSTTNKTSKCAIFRDRAVLRYLTDRAAPSIYRLHGSASLGEPFTQALGSAPDLFQSKLVCVCVCIYTCVCAFLRVWKQCIFKVGSYCTFEVYNPTSLCVGRSVNCT
jgi:hypothetical protein